MTEQLNICGVKWPIHGWELKNCTKRLKEDTVYCSWEGKLFYTHRLSRMHWCFAQMNTFFWIFFRIINTRMIFTQNFKRNSSWIQMMWLTILALNPSMLLIVPNYKNISTIHITIQYSVRHLTFFFFIYYAVRSIRHTTLMLCADCAKQFVRNAQNCGKSNHGFCTMIAHQLTHLCLCLSFWPKI